MSTFGIFAHFLEPNYQSWNPVGARKSTFRNSDWMLVLRCRWVRVILGAPPSILPRNAVCMCVLKTDKYTSYLDWRPVDTEYIATVFSWDLSVDIWGPWLLRTDKHTTALHCTVPSIVFLLGNGIILYIKSSICACNWNNVLASIKILNIVLWSLKGSHRKGMRLLKNNWAKPMQKCLQTIFSKKNYAYILNSYVWKQPGCKEALSGS